MLKKLVSFVLKAKQTKAIEEELNTKLLAKVPFLEGADYGLIQDLAAALDSQRFAEGAMVFAEGDEANSLFLIVEGTVQISSNGEVITELELGGCFGEGALIEKKVRGASALATSPTRLLELKREAFVELTEKYGKVRLRLKQHHERRRAQDIGKSIERNLLNDAPFLSGAGGALINELAQYLERKTYVKGDTLMEEGAEGASMFLIEKGTVYVLKGDKQVAELEPGACVGEGALFSRRPRSATVTAASEVSCFELGKGAFDRIIARYPVFAKRLRAIHEERC